METNDSVSELDHLDQGQQASRRVLEVASLLMACRDTSEKGSAALPKDSRAAGFIPWLSILFPAMRRLRTRLLLL